MKLLLFLPNLTEPKMLFGLSGPAVAPCAHCWEVWQELRWNGWSSVSFPWAEKSSNGWRQCWAAKFVQHTAQHLLRWVIVSASCLKHCLFKAASCHEYGIIFKPFLLSRFMFKSAGVRDRKADFSLRLSQPRPSSRTCAHSQRYLGHDFISLLPNGSKYILMVSPTSWYNYSCLGEPAKSSQVGQIGKNITSAFTSICFVYFVFCFLFFCT